MDAGADGRDLDLVDWDLEVVSLSLSDMCVTIDKLVFRYRWEYEGRLTFRSRLALLATLWFRSFRHLGFHFEYDEVIFYLSLRPSSVKETGKCSMYCT